MQSVCGTSCITRPCGMLCWYCPDHLAEAHYFGERDGFISPHLAQDIIDVVEHAGVFHFRQVYGSTLSISIVRETPRRKQNLFRLFAMLSRAADCSPYERVIALIGQMRCGLPPFEVVYTDVAMESTRSLKRVQEHSTHINQRQVVQKQTRSTWSNRCPDVGSWTVGQLGHGLDMISL
eukprot:TRINITY_DN9048_c0_g1_i1.p2 TRINITY_DN9048_c0_g1~~TRINITY_DN9048_c0_g1_i1.p2  ORF type:complete len:178 (-),score=24.97 TRINITY_DN9048_c0_g1_i1:68-601(-)